MKKFRELFVECGCGNAPVVSLSKVMVDLESPATRDEINRNLSAVLTEKFTSPQGAMLKIARVLSLYNIFIPKLDYDNKENGEKIITITQFGDRWGRKVDGTITSPGNPDTPKYFLYFSYRLDDGFYDAKASVGDISEINQIVASSTLQPIPTEGEFDFPQKR